MFLKISENFEDYCGEFRDSFKKNFEKVSENSDN